MAVDTYGTKGEPQFASGGAPAIDVDPTAVAAYAAMVGNRIADTNAKRTANVFPNGSGKPITDGVLWYETDTGDTYLRDQGAWVFVSTRGNLPFPAMFSPGTWNANTSFMWKEGRKINYHWSLTKTAALATGDLIFVLPAGQRPPVDVVIPAAAVNGGSEGLGGYLSITAADGGVRVFGTPNASIRTLKATGYFPLA